MTPRRRPRPIYPRRPEPDWRKVAHDLAWSRIGQPHTPEEQAALDAYDAAVRVEQFNRLASHRARSVDG